MVIAVRADNDVRERACLSGRRCSGQGSGGVAERCPGRAVDDAEVDRAGGRTGARCEGIGRSRSDRGSGRAGNRRLSGNHLNGERCQRGRARAIACGDDDAAVGALRRARGSAAQSAGCSAESRPCRHVLHGKGDRRGALHARLKGVTAARQDARRRSAGYRERTRGRAGRHDAQSCGYARCGQQANQRLSRPCKIRSTHRYPLPTRASSSSDTRAAKARSEGARL